MAKEHERDVRDPPPEVNPDPPPATDVPGPEVVFGQTHQDFDGEADPALIIKENNRRRVYAQQGLTPPPDPNAPDWPPGSNTPPTEPEDPDKPGQGPKAEVRKRDDDDEDDKKNKKGK